MVILFADKVVTNGVIFELMQQLKQLNDTVNERVDTIDSRLQKVEGNTKKKFEFRFLQKII